MIEPEVTAVLGRRLLAFLIDSSLVAATGLGVAFRSSTAFAVVGRDPDDNPFVDPEEFEAIEDMLDFELFGQSEILGFPVVRAQELGDSYRVFGADSYQSGLLAALVAALVLFGLVPIVLQRTLGMVPFGLGIRTTSGTKAGVVAHLKRTIMGFVDAIPFVIPGVLGFITARGSTHRQRLGDRIGKTTVVSVKALRESGIAGETVDLDLPADQSDLDQPPGLDDSPLASGSLESDGLESSSLESSNLTTTTDPIDAAVSAEHAATPSTPPAVSDRLREAKATPTAADKPPVAKPTFGDPLPPPPVHRKPPSEHPLGTPSDRGLDTPAVETDIDPDFSAASEVDAPTATAAEHLSAQQPLAIDLDALEAEATGDLEVPDRAWQPPREEPAPVWQPTTLETAPVESPDPHDGRTIDSLERIDPSIGALLATESTDDTESTDSTRGGNHSQKESSAKAPVWSDKWRAWMYWDSAKKCWLRHDTTSNTWQPVD